MPAREQVQKIQGFGLRLRNRLAALKMTQTALAERTRLSRQTLHRAIHQDELTGGVAKKIASVVGADLLSVEVGAPALALVSNGESTADHTIPSGAPDDAGDLAGQLTPLGEVLEILRRDEGMSQEYMAAEAEISVATYRRLITGKTRAKDAWLVRWGEGTELQSPEDMLSLKSFKRGDAFHRAVGRQMHAWRVSAGLDLIDVADVCGESALTLARYEAGDDENFIALSEIAPLYGTSSSVIYRAAMLAAPDEEDARWRPPVERVMTFEAAQMHAHEQQKRREEDRRECVWDFELASELTAARLRAGFDLSHVSERIKRPAKQIDRWEEGEEEPSMQDLERLAILYRTTPWALRYGDDWQRAMAFPNADQSRSFIFGKLFPPEMRAWMYRALAEFATLGLDDGELTYIRETLTNPDRYADMLAASSPEEAERFLWARLTSEATDAWRNITDPDWVERPAAAWRPLPPIFTPPGLTQTEVQETVQDFRRRRMRMSFDSALRAMNDATRNFRSSAGVSGTGAATTTAVPLDVFGFYRDAPRVTLRVAETTRPAVASIEADGAATAESMTPAASGEGPKPRVDQ